MYMMHAEEGGYSCDDEKRLTVPPPTSPKTVACFKVRGPRGTGVVVGMLYTRMIQSHSAMEGAPRNDYGEAHVGMTCDWG